MKPGIVLVHGYSGRPETLAPVGHRLREQYGEDSVRTVVLPGHTDSSVPAFDAGRFGRVIDEAVGSFQNKNRAIILLGHSTGGSLVLDHLQRRKTVPALLILAGTPAVIQGSDLERWEKHRRDCVELPLSDVARMVSCVNQVGAISLSAAFPVLILQGGADNLVPPAHAKMWQQGRFCGPLRCIVIPQAGHQLFYGPGAQAALDCIMRTVADACGRIDNGQKAMIDKLAAMDTDVRDFWKAKPQSIQHLIRSPAAMRALGQPVHLTPTVKNDPIQLNIEITTHCNLACGHCARSFRSPSQKHMDPDEFEYILNLMPNTFKVVLVGLGEPTLHPQLVEMVALATRKSHRVGMVTNAMRLEKKVSQRLIAAGLRYLTFSLDSVDANAVSRVRPGSNINRIIRNIREFMELNGEMVQTAVFTAVSMDTVHHLPSLADTVASLGVNAWMLSDLNFQQNKSKSLWGNWENVNQKAIGEAIRMAFSRSIPVLSIHGLEALGLPHRYMDYLMLRPTGLGQKAVLHNCCLSPWQTLPVDVNGVATACDCRPHVSLGSLLNKPFSRIWNGNLMETHRRQMRSNTPPADCLACPRF
jgi:MoaA/NifB/PqqE/SkfB family radical SAM enzyme/pimeloyl-ACP methyl ester carboxylesterase